MLKIHGLPFSAHTRKVIVAAIEKGIPYELISAMPLAPAEGWDKLSPLGKIPAIEDEGCALADSSVINLYLEQRYPARSIYPSDAQQYGRALWIEEYVDGALAPHVLHDLLMQRVFAPRFLNRAPDQALIERAITQMIPLRLDYLEQALEGEYFAGGGFSVADITVASMLMNFHYAGESLDTARHPKLAAHLQRTLRRDSLRRALAVELPAAQSLGALDMRLLTTLNH